MYVLLPVLNVVQMDRTSGPSQVRRFALWVMAAAIFLIFAFQLLSPSKPVAKLDIPSPILADQTRTCHVYKPAKRVAIVGQSVALSRLRGDIQRTDRMRKKELDLEALRQLIISISSKILVAQ